MPPKADQTTKPPLVSAPPERVRTFEVRSPDGRRSLTLTFSRVLVDGEEPHAALSADVEWVRMEATRAVHWLTAEVRGVQGVQA